MNASKIDALIEKSDNPAKMKKIIDQLNATGFNDAFMTGREIKELPKLMADDEVIKYATSGMIGYKGDSVLVVVTNELVLFENKKLLFGSSNTDIPLSAINGVSYDTGMIFGKVSFMNGMGSITIKQIQKTNTEPLSSAIKQAVNAAKNGITNEVHSEMKQADAPISANKLREMKQLADDGIISNEEFEAAKKKYLGL
ncbi:PH domain-containing protein (plasmid) [Nicoliella spurrieriana]|uniref:PH domain-containing protein n=1 Tax=Nicoliella spurrieriana TaxID=2925830 RepID=A0A976RR06_9LACO|nr:PH domain-containing protein [Nicoliella spurrieriana]UQS86171.1 PH domain-containing protein [Nicoliella spurrieriana]